MKGGLLITNANKKMFGFETKEIVSRFQYCAKYKEREKNSRRQK